MRVRRTPRCRRSSATVTTILSGAGQRLAWIELQNGERDSARALDVALLDRVREKFSRVPPAYARLLAINASLKSASANDSTAEGEFRDALELLKSGTRIDSAALPGIVVRYASALRARGKETEAAALLRRTVAWIPATADSGSAILGELRSELKLTAELGSRAERASSSTMIHKFQKIFTNRVDFGAAHSTYM